LTSYQKYEVSNLQNIVINNSHKTVTWTWMRQFHW